MPYGTHRIAETQGHEYVTTLRLGGYLGDGAALSGRENQTFGKISLQRHGTANTQVVRIAIEWHVAFPNLAVVVTEPLNRVKETE